MENNTNQKPSKKITGQVVLMEKDKNNLNQDIGYEAVSKDAKDFLTKNKINTNQYTIGQEIYFNTIRGKTTFFEVTYVSGEDKHYVYLENGYVIDKFSNVLFSDKTRKVSKEFFLTSDEQNRNYEIKHGKIVYKYNILGIFYRLEFGSKIKILDRDAVVYIYINNIEYKYNYIATSKSIDIIDFGKFIYDDDGNLIYISPVQYIFEREK